MVKLITPADALYCFEELLLVAGKLLGEEITPRTVRLYATQALKDRPGKEGRSKNPSACGRPMTGRLSDDQRTVAWSLRLMGLEQKHHLEHRSAI